MAKIFSFFSLLNRLPEKYSSFLGQMFKYQLKEKDPLIYRVAVSGCLENASRENSATGCVPGESKWIGTQDNLTSLL